MLISIRLLYKLSIIVNLLVIRKTHRNTIISGWSRNTRLTSVSAWSWWSVITIQPRGSWWSSRSRGARTTLVTWRSRWSFSSLVSWRTLWSLRSITSLLCTRKRERIQLQCFTFLCSELITAYKIYTLPFKIKLWYSQQLQVDQHLQGLQGIHVGPRAEYKRNIH